MVVGSRAHLEKQAMAKRNRLRNFLTKGFHFLVLLVAGGAVRDTQCGFKVSQGHAGGAWSWGVAALRCAGQAHFQVDWRGQRSHQCGFSPSVISKLLMTHAECIWWRARLKCPTPGSC